ncbi:MAG TPA: glycosyltransferase family 4 protein [Candidatus Limnocylindrales bacterium]|nr:glycosyltransferase family 4 protein [Candidatus Limnocylindrales bacterium]
MRIGFACLWDRDAASTWSRTPWELRAAMRAHAEVVDAGVHVPIPARRLLQAAHVKIRNRQLISLWEQGSLTDRYCRAQLSKRDDLDVLLQMQDLAAVDIPYFTYQDMSFDALLSLRGQGLDVFRILTTKEMHRRRERQLGIYAKATGVIAMSRWLADSLVRDTGLPREKVHVVHPGLVAGNSAPLPERPSPRRRLLFIGRTFASKGGDIVLKALARLRHEVDPRITLTIAGPPTMAEVSDGVNFLGALPGREVAKLYDTHDLFVLPTRIEGFGIVFAEALARGLPCVGRNNFAMPEIIQAPRYGSLLDGDDPDQLVKLITEALGDDDLYRRCAEDAEATRAYYSWDRAARETVRAVTLRPKG